MMAEYKVEIKLHVNVEAETKEDAIEYASDLALVGRENSTVYSAKVIETCGKRELSVVMKTPDAVAEAVDQFIRDEAIRLSDNITYEQIADMCPEDFEDIFKEKIGMSKNDIYNKVNRFFKYGECATINIDIDTGIASIKEQS